MTIESLYELFLQHPTITTDSRNITTGSIFFALRGKHFDGNLYAESAIKKGAAYAIIDDASYKKGERYIVVEDSLTTLQQLATHHRRQFFIPIIAITGSNGKTTTKELLGNILASQYPTLFTRGNFNNHIGVPLTLLQLKKDTEVAVIEMGANHIGEIDALCKIAEPTHGLITSIGKAHLEGFGGLDGVIQAKTELYRYLQEKGKVIFVNKDDALIYKLSEANRKRVFYCKSQAPSLTNPSFEIVYQSVNPFVVLSFLDQNGQLLTASTQLMGDYNFFNLMAAVSIGKYFKVPAEKIKTVIEEYVPSNNRSQIIRQHTNTYILDAYNANPTSMGHALENFKQLNAPKKIAILGAMLELGKYSHEEHKHILKLARSGNFNAIYVVGAEFALAAAQTGTRFFNNTVELKTYLNNKNFQHTHFLLKGSRGIGLEKLLA